MSVHACVYSTRHLRGESDRRRSKRVLLQARSDRGGWRVKGARKRENREALRMKGTMGYVKWRCVFERCILLPCAALLGVFAMVAVDHDTFDIRDSLTDFCVL
jgi:hypothetical protein